MGAEFLGLTGTLGNILGFLSLAELGVGTATAYNLYKPLQENDREKINELVSVFGYLYKNIGFVILGLGIIISAFFPLIFKSAELHLFIVFAAFFSILTSSLISYFINFRQIVLSADQKGYLVTGYLQGANIVKVLIQIAFALTWGNLYAYIAIELSFSVIACIILNLRINKEYPWLETSSAKGKQALPGNKALVSNIKQIFVHKFASFVQLQSDQIFIFAFVSLKMVAFYGNYMIIIDKLSQAVNSALGSFGAGVGNLIAEGDSERIEIVFWEIMSLRFLVAGVIIFCFYHLVEPFISLWLGSEYILDRKILIFLLIIVYVTTTRGAVDMFKEGYGLFADTWAPIVEAAVNIVVTLITAPKFGICGILLGKIVSLFAIVVIWKPYYVFSKGFHESVWTYWKEYSKYLITLAVSFLVCHYFLVSLDFMAITSSTIVNWILSAITAMLSFAVVYLGTLYVCTKGTHSLIIRCYKHIFQKYY